MIKSSGWKEKMRANRRQLELDLLNSPRRRYFSPIYYVQYRVTLTLMRRYVKGRLIDLGCGDLPFKDELVNQVTRYDSLDFSPRSTHVTYASDIQNMSIVPSEAYDSAICLEVLEHVPDPFRAVREIHRVLVPGGLLILSVPHLSRLHDEPHDYYRYTRYGLKHMLEEAGFEIVELRHRGGLLSFLGHQLSTIILGSVWSVPVVSQVAWFLNSWLITRSCTWLDERLPQADLLPAGYIAVATRLPDGPV